MASDPRWKAAERLVARKLQDAVGQVSDPVLKNLVTSTGRIGHLTELGVDLVCGNPAEGTALIGEVKRRRLPGWLRDALVQIVARGYEYNRTPALAFQLADDAEDWITTKVGRKRMERTWVAVPLPYFAELMKARRKLKRGEDFGTIQAL